MTHPSRNRHRDRLPDVVEIAGWTAEESPSSVGDGYSAVKRASQLSLATREETSLHAAVNDPTISIAATWRERCLKERAALFVFLLCCFSGFVDIPADGLFFWVAVGCLVITQLRKVCRLFVRIGGLFVFPSTTGSKYGE